MKQWFFSKLLANVSFGKYFITKTVVFSPHFSSSLQKCSVVFFSHFLLRPLEHGTLCVGLPQVSATGGLSSSRCLDGVGQPVIALWWANPCLLGIKKCSFTLFLECPWSHCLTETSHCPLIGRGAVINWCDFSCIRANPAIVGPSPPVVLYFSRAVNNVCGVIILWLTIHLIQPFRLLHLSLSPWLMIFWPSWLRAF